jgi:hypothetical protein
MHVHVIVRHVKVKVFRTIQLMHAGKRNIVALVLMFILESPVQYLFTLVFMLKYIDFFI